MSEVSPIVRLLSEACRTGKERPYRHAEAIPKRAIMEQ